MDATRLPGLTGGTIPAAPCSDSGKRAGLEVDGRLVDQDCDA
jgi:hypothetical protein